MTFSDTATIKRLRKPREKKTPSPINRAETKRILMAYAKSTRAHQFTQVSKATLDKLEAQHIANIRRKVDTQPSRGKTL